MSESLAEMSDENIRRCLYNRKYSAHETNEETKQLITNVLKAIYEPLPIVELTTGREFVSAFEAAATFGISSSAVTHSVRELVFVKHGTIAFARKFGAILDEYAPAKRQAIVELTSGHIFSSIGLCARQLGISPKSIRRSIGKLVFVSDDTFAFNTQASMHVHAREEHNQPHKPPRGHTLASNHVPRSIRCTMTPTAECPIT